MGRILRYHIGTLIGIFVFAFNFPQAMAADVFGVDEEIPPTAATPLGGGHACLLGPLEEPLLLADAVERSLCNNPKTGEAWAEIKAKAAALGTARGAYLPTLSATGQELREDAKTTLPGYSDLNSNNLSSNYSVGLSLSWVLYDFGGRAAALDNAKALLMAAQANHLETLQTVFITTAKDYYAAQAAAGDLAAAMDTEQIAQKSLEVVIRKEEHGAASVGDELQARTAYLQAETNRTHSAGAWQSAMGVLAEDLSLRPDTPLALPDVDQGVKPDREFQQSVSALINEAARIHPGILMAEAELKAAEANVRQTEAEGRPSISLVGRSSRDNQRVNESLGQPYLAARHTDNYLGVQVSIPLFEGMTRGYKTKEALAQVEEKQQSLNDARNGVELDVWKSYQSLKASTESLPVAKDLLMVARKSYVAADYRYENGVGSLLELLNSQTALANAEKQQLQSLTDWRYDRLQLAEKLGHLGLESIDRGQ
jgi:outer membrane protein